jgi:hypothetical protein
MTSTLYLPIGLQFRRFLLEFLIIIAKTPEGALVSIARSLNKGREHLPHKRSERMRARFI